MKKAFFGAAAFFILGAMSASTWAQTTSPENYPTKPVRIVVGYPPGAAGNDMIARFVGTKLQDKWARPVVIENKPGADSIIATEYVAKSVPDGYTLLVNGSGGMSTNPALYPDLPYDSLRDFSPICMLAHSDMMLAVHPSVRANSVREFVADTKSRPGVTNYSSGNAFFQLIAEVFKQISGADINHVPYKGGAPMMNAALSGEVQMVLPNVGSVAEFVRSGRLKPLAVTSSKRLESFPDVPTFAEVGMSSFDLAIWIGLFAPARTPPGIVAKLQADVGQILNLPEIREKLNATGWAPESTCASGSLISTLKSEIPRYKSAAKTAGIKAR